MFRQYLIILLSFIVLLNCSGSDQATSGSAIVIKGQTSCVQNGFQWSSPTICSLPDKYKLESGITLTVKDGVTALVSNLDNNGTLTINANSTLALSNSLNNASGGTIISEKNGSINLSSNNSLNNAGTLTNNGTLKISLESAYTGNQTIITNAGGANLTNNGTITVKFDPNQTGKAKSIEVTPPQTSEAFQSMKQSVTTEQTAYIIQGSGNITNSQNSTIDLTELSVTTPTIYLELGGNLVNSGTITSEGHIKIKGNLENQAGASIQFGQTYNGQLSLIEEGNFTNAGSLINSKSSMISVYGTLINSGSFTNDNMSAVIFSGIVNNKGNLTNNKGGAINMFGGKLTNDGSITNNGYLPIYTGSVNSNGKIANNSGGTISNSVAIFCGPSKDAVVNHGVIQNCQGGKILCSVTGNQPENTCS